MTDLYPVIMAVPPDLADLTRGEKQRALSRLARRPLALSALKTGLTLPTVLEKDGRGAPRPVDGLWWSVTHKPEFVAGIVSSRKTGIDIEKIAPWSPALLKKIADPAERALFVDDPGIILFRCWTAKEAVLKAEGRGLGGLSRCRIERVVNDKLMRIVFDQNAWLVEQCFFHGHVAAVVKNRTDRVFWKLLNEKGEEIPWESAGRMMPPPASAG